MVVIRPKVVIRRSPNGSYRLAELDGTISKLCFAAFRLVPYHTRSRTSIPVTRIVEHEDLMRIHLDEDLEDAAADPEDGTSSEGSDA